MFDFLKKKISAFTEKVKKKIEGKPKEKAEESKTPPEEKAELKTHEKPRDITGKKLKPVEKPELPKAGEGTVKEEKPGKEETRQKAEEEKPEEKEKAGKEVEKEEETARKAEAGEKPGKRIEIPVEEPEKEEKPEKIVEEAKPEEIEAPKKTPEKEVREAGKEATEAPSGEKKKPIEKIREIRAEEKRELKAKVSLKERIKGFVTGTVTVEENDVAGFLDEFELALLESDVEQDTAKEIVSEIGKEIVGKKIPRGKDVSAVLKEEIRKILSRIMETEQVDILKELAAKKPYVILMLGPNGAGKTTSIAKLTSLLQGKGKKVILAASDTFRAASIEQLEKHAETLGVRVVKHDYGADPAAVAFDAVRAAEAKGIDVVLIDSAGRQDTNKNLMEELKKINRVSKADLRIYVGEAFTGQALLQQASEFNKTLGIDGFILTKIDADVKGGTSISLLHKLKKPILYIGTGQRYEDLLAFKPEYIIDRIVA